MTDKPPGFVPLSTVRSGRPDSRAALAQIREIYFKTSKRTIEHDIVHAIELLKSLGSEDEREKATVYMHGLAEMRKEWGTTEQGTTGTKERGNKVTKRQRDEGTKGRRDEGAAGSSARRKRKP